jgi:hypothetical protein
VVTDSDALTREKIGTRLYRDALVIRDILQRFETLPNEVINELSTTEYHAVSDLYTDGEGFMQALKRLGMRLNRRAMGDADDEIEAEREAGEREMRENAKGVKP